MFHMWLMQRKNAKIMKVITIILYDFICIIYFP